MFDLPLDLLPCIVSHLENRLHLHTACLVNKDFYNFAVAELYSRISVYSWHQGGKRKVIQLFQTLARYPRLAAHVRRLEIRDFPKALPSDKDDIVLSVLHGLQNCVNLRSCSWTRDGSLNSDILRSMHRLPGLSKLEINGHDQGNYDARLLSLFDHLSSITIIMPSAAVTAILPVWLGATETTLSSLTLICKSSTLITDDTLARIAPHLRNLTHFHLAGCPKVTHVGIWNILSSNETGLCGLGLEGLSPRFDMSELARLSSNSTVLHSLRSITLTVNHQTPLGVWTRNVLDVLSSSPLETFQIYSTGAVLESSPTVEFWENIVSAHGTTLRRFSVHRMLIGLESIEDVCRRCPQLQELFVVVEHSSLSALHPVLSLAKRLRILHINFPLEAQIESSPVLQIREAMELVRHCSSTLVQLGGNTKVWHVERTVSLDTEGQHHVDRTLTRYSSPDIPEQFLVVRI